MASQESLAPNARSDAEAVAYRALWRQLPKENDGSSAATIAWHHIKDVVADPTSTVDDVAQALDSVIADPHQYAAYQTFTAYRDRAVNASVDVGDGDSG